MPKISIVIPSYNRGHLLDETLESVAAQTFRDWECVIVVGGSDNAAQVASEWSRKDDRFSFIEKRTSGPSESRNLGVLSTSGTYIFPLDDDDKIAPEWLGKALGVIESDPQIKAVTSRVMQFGHINEELQLPGFSYSGLLLRNQLICCSLYRREDFVRIGGYDENFAILEDWEFWIRMFKHGGKAHRIDEFLYFYRKHESGSLENSFSANRDQHSRHLRMLYVKHADMYIERLGHPLQLYKENVELRAFRDKTVGSWWYRLLKFPVKLLKKLD